MNKPELDLVGQDGNSMMILGRAQRAAKQAGWTPEQIKEYMDKAMSGDYDNLLRVTMEYFNCDPDDEDEEKEDE